MKTGCCVYPLTLSVRNGQETKDELIDFLLSESLLTWFICILFLIFTCLLKDVLWAQCCVQMAAMVHTFSIAHPQWLLRMRINLKPWNRSTRIDLWCCWCAVKCIFYVWTWSGVSSWESLIPTHRESGKVGLSGDLWGFLLNIQCKRDKERSLLSTSSMFV